MRWLTGSILSVLLAVSSLTTGRIDTSVKPQLAVPPAATALSGDVSGVALSASAGEVVDLTTGRVLYQKQADSERAQASLTKLMTALVILRDHQLTDVVMVSPDINDLDGTGSQLLGLVVGDKLTVDQALRGLLIHSGNDVAVALASWDAGSQAAFVAKMNSLASQLGLTETHFANSDGLDAPSHYSSAHDLATLSEVLLQSPEVRGIVRRKSDGFTTELGHTYNFVSTNDLLANPDVQGLKTGYTGNAGDCLITYAKSNGHDILTVVLNSPDRFGESANLIKAAFKLPSNP